MIAIAVTAMICVTLITLFVLYLRAAAFDARDEITILQAAQESHALRLDQLERDSKKHGEAVTKFNVGKIR